MMALLQILEAIFTSPSNTVIGNKSSWVGVNNYIGKSNGYHPTMIPLDDQNKYSPITYTKPLVKQINGFLHIASD
jgi:hypothetical protein